MADSKPEPRRTRASVKAAARIDATYIDQYLSGFVGNFAADVEVRRQGISATIAAAMDEAILREQLPPFESGIYRHYMGGLYNALFLAYEEKTMEPVVVYISCETGKPFTRPLAEWHENVYGVDRVIRRFTKASP